MADQAHGKRGRLRVIVHSAEPPLAHPVDFVRTVWNDLRRSGPLALGLAKRDIIAQYRQSWLGVVLILLPPLAMAFFGMGFRRAGILNVEDLMIPYGAYVLYGVVLWTTFVDALNAPVQGLLAEQRLLSRTDAPFEAIVLGGLGTVLFNFCVKAVILVAASLWFQLAPPSSIVLAPLGLAALLALATGLGIILGTFNLIYRDVSKILGSLLTFWFFASPVYYTVPKEGNIATILNLNPVTHLLDGTRRMATSGLDSALESWALVFFAPFVLLVVAWVWARVSMPVLLERDN